MSTFDTYAGPEIIDAGWVRVGERVAYDPEGGHGGRPMIWHWCTKEGWWARAQREGWTPDPESMRPAWLPAGCEGHDLISVSPLHLEPSVYWPDCCGLHGWIRDDVWMSA